ncbi:hypothetical protein F4695_004345 [Rhizobium soli]|uniref:Antifreeze protein n=1 Tax=Rhizobium soli TaxID=424798 RepID=A0A7X0JNQ2_9HYPH|nr:hypothetical protein [Rhizobium soli]
MKKLAIIVISIMTAFTGYVPAQATPKAPIAATAPVTDSRFNTETTTAAMFPAASDATAIATIVGIVMIAATVTATAATIVVTITAAAIMRALSSAASLQAPSSAARSLRRTATAAAAVQRVTARTAPLTTRISPARDHVASAAKF